MVEAASSLMSDNSLFRPGSSRWLRLCHWKRSGPNRDKRPQKPEKGKRHANRLAGIYRLDTIAVRFVI